MALFVTLFFYVSFIIKDKDFLYFMEWLFKSFDLHKIVSLSSKSIFVGYLGEYSYLVNTW